MAHKIKRIMSILLVMVLLIMTFAGIDLKKAKETRVQAKTINDHNELSASTRYNLYVRESDLSVVVEDKESGAFMESAISYDDGKSNKTWYAAMQSAVVITMISGNDDTKQADLLRDNVKKTINYTSNGFTADLYWTKYQFGLRLEVALTDEGLVVRVPDESIVEDGEQYKIGTISLYPYMGTSYLDDKEGYIFVPDGNGALIYLNNKEGKFNSGYSSMIYGKDIGFEESTTESLLWNRYRMITDAEQVIAPVFGIAHTDDQMAYLAVVEDGANRGIIECMPNGVSVDYNRAYVKFVERKLYTQPTSNNSTSGSLHLCEAERAHSDLQVRYLFLNGEKANYTGMAETYRNYLIKNGYIRTDIDDSYSTRIDFLGTDRESFLLGTTAVVMTTVDDMKEIYADLEKAGVTDILSVYKGWQKKGIYNLPVSKYKTDSKIGSASELAELIDALAEKGTDLYLYNDALRANPDENSTTFGTVKRINKKKYEEKTYKDVYQNMNFLIPSKSDANLTALAKSLNSKGVKNVALAGITNNLFSYYYSGDTFSRYNTAEDYSKIVEKADETLEMVMEQPFAYLWKNSKAFLDIPLYTSSYVYEDAFVPFISLVLKGVMPTYSEYVNFEANKQEFFLKLIETGTYPSFYITKNSSSKLIYTNSCDIYSSQYEAYREEILTYDLALKTLNKKVEGATVKSHDILGNGITRVIYTNGVTVYVNYSESAQTADGNTIDSMSCLIKD